MSGRGKRYHWTEADLERMAWLYAQGYSLPAVAERTGWAAK